MSLLHRFSLTSLAAAFVLMPAACAESHEHDHGEGDGHDHTHCYGNQHHTRGDNAPQAGHLVDGTQEHSHAPFEHLCAHSWDLELGGYADNKDMQKWVEDGLRHVHYDHVPTAKSVSRLCWVEGARTLAVGQREQARTWLMMSREDEALTNLACLEYENGRVEEGIRILEELLRMEEEQGTSIPVSITLSLPMMRYAAGLINREQLEKAAADHAKGAGAWVHEYVDLQWILDKVVRTPEDARYLRSRLEAAAAAGNSEAEVALIALAEMRVVIVGQRPGWQQRLEALVPKYPRAAKLKERVEMLRWVLNECLPTLMPKSSR